MSTYQGDERRDQRLKSKMIREWIGQAILLEPQRGSMSFANVHNVASMAWRTAYELGRKDGAKEVMEHVELELGALREGLKED